MSRRSPVLAVAALAALALSSQATPAAAADSTPLHLERATVAVFAPVATDDTCDQGSQLYCGYVSVTAELSGLQDRGAADVFVPIAGDLQGSVDVTRTYGCQTSRGKRLHRYDTQVRTTEALETRRAFGYALQGDGNDTLTVSTYAFLFDAQPDNCPAGTRAYEYAIRAKHVRLELVSAVDTIPSASYRVHGRAGWSGAVPTPGPLV